MNITVTREDIEHGQRRDPEQCAIARALMRAGLDHFGVMGPSVMVADGWGRLTSLRLPESVSDWIFNFDAGNPVEPISFRLDIPDQTGGKGPKERAKSAECLPDTPPQPAPSFSSIEFIPAAPVRSRTSRRGSSTVKIPKLGSKRNRGLNLALKLG